MHDLCATVHGRCGAVQWFTPTTVSGDHCVLCRSVRPHPQQRSAHSTGSSGAFPTQLMCTAHAFHSSCAQLLTAPCQGPRSHHIAQSTWPRAEPETTHTFSLLRAPCMHCQRTWCPTPQGHTSKPCMITHHHTSPRSHDQFKTHHKLVHKTQTRTTLKP